MEFWQWLVQSGLIQGDPNYYASGQASPDEYKHAIRTAIGGLATASDPRARSELFTRLQAAGAIQGDPNYYISGQAQPDEIENLINVAGDFFDTSPTKPPAASTTAPQTPSKPDPLEPGAPAKPKVGTPTGVLAGGTTVRVRQPDGTYRWYQAYRLPPGSGALVAYQYNNIEQLRAAVGNDISFVSRDTNWEKAIMATGAAEEIIGMAGNWNTFSQEVMRDTALAAGIRDPSVIGKMWADPQMQQIAAKALIGDWTPEQILAEQRRTNFWQNVLYPGINNFYGSTTEPERAWSNYVDNVTPALTALGYSKDAAGTYNAQIKKMLDSKIDAQVFLENAPVFQQAVNNSQFFEVLRQRSQAELGKDITFGDWFGLVKGETSPELAKVAEGAVVAYEAQQAKFGLAEDQLQRLINERDLSAQEARNVFSEVNQAVLALGDTGLSRGGLSRDDILSAAAGIAPQTGMSADEVRLKVAKLAQENDLFDEDKISFYVGFDPTGRPNRPGLLALAPEGA
jgi:hypothetical protein